MKAIYWLSVASFLSLVMSMGVIAYLCKEGGCYGIKNISFGDASVSVLGAMVGLLVGWQIYNVLDLKKEWKENKLKIEKIEELVKSIQIEKYNQRALNMSTQANSFIQAKNFSSALDCCLQSLYNMLYDLKTNSELGNLDNINDWIQISLYDDDNRIRSDFEFYNIEYMESLVSSIRRHDNYSIVRSQFDRLLEDVEKVLLDYKKEKTNE